MSKERRCIRITGTRTGKLRAKVEEILSHDQMMLLRPRCCNVATWEEAIRTKKPAGRRFEVTLGGEKWRTLDPKLQDAIYERAQAYVDHLNDQLNELQ